MAIVAYLPASLRVIFVVGALAALLGAGAAQPLDAAGATPLAVDCADAIPLGDLIPDDFQVPAHLPLVDACPGLRPGARQSNGCTLNFVFREGNELYMGTAGHCTSNVGQRISAAGVGQFGTVVYRINQGVGSDFALIRVDASMRDLVNPTMCAWGGPLGAEPTTIPGQHVHHYGWGTATNDFAPTRARAGVLLSVSASAINFVGLASGGDSGSPTTNMDGDALGVNTHVLGTAQGSPVVFGTSISRIFALTQGAGYTLELVPGEPGGVP